LLIELDNWLNAQDSQKADETIQGPRLRTGVGIYHFVEED
jgi:hypothetical protein